MGTVNNIINEIDFLDPYSIKRAQKELSQLAKSPESVKQMNGYKFVKAPVAVVTSSQSIPNPDSSKALKLARSPSIESKNKRKRYTLGG